MNLKLSTKQKLLAVSEAVFLGDTQYYDCTWMYLLFYDIQRGRNSHYIHVVFAG